MFASSFYLPWLKSNWKAASDSSTWQMYKLDSGTLEQMSVSVQLTGVKE